MKRLIIAVVAFIGLIALVVIGCTNKALVGPSPEEEAVNSCVACHTDKNVLKELATEVEVVASAETTGEG
jgi:nitrate/TMAO reductase-like tetraheme cytochrome c subunit